MSPFSRILQMSLVVAPDNTTLASKSLRAPASSSCQGNLGWNNTSAAQNIRPRPGKPMECFAPLLSPSPWQWSHELHNPQRNRQPPLVSRCDNANDHLSALCTHSSVPSAINWHVDNSAIGTAWKTLNGSLKNYKWILHQILQETSREQPTLEPTSEESDQYASTVPQNS